MTGSVRNGTATAGESPSSSLVRWITAGAVGFLTGGALGALVELLFVHQMALIPSIGIGGQSLPLGFTFGAALTPLLQARWALPAHIHRGWWAATGLVALVAGLVAHSRQYLTLTGTPSGFGDDIIIAAAVIVSLVLCQWLVLTGSKLPRAWLWLLTVILWFISLPIGWAAGLGFGVPLSMFASLLVGGIAGLIGAATIATAAGLIATVLTAPLLNHLLTYSPKTPAPQK